MKKDVSLASFTSWLVGGPAEYFSEPKTLEEFKSTILSATSQKLPITILGGGTNVLISDLGIKGLVISLRQWTGVEVKEEDGELRIWCKSGTPKSELLKIFLKAKLAPAKMLAGLPGQVGGGVVMNAGVSEKIEPREFHEVVKSLRVLDLTGQEKMINHDQLRWSYRHCDGWGPGILTHVLIGWPNKPDETVVTQVKELNKSRLSKQPLDMPSCGSVFRNPLPHYAGALIEQAGLKGARIGGAEVSSKHANFIVNVGGAKASDILGLIRLCQKKVKEQSGIELQTEVVLLGTI